MNSNKTTKMLCRIGCLYNNGYRIYVDIMTGETCRQFSLLTWTLFIGQFVHQVGGGVKGGYGGWIVILAC